MSAFDTDDSNGHFVLAVDTSQLHDERPVTVYPAAAEQLHVHVGEAPVVRFRFLYTEAEELWRLLDQTIGNHVREREAVVRDMGDYVTRWGDAHVPTKEQYEQAIQELVDLRLPQDDPRVVKAAEIIGRYEQAAGLT